MKVSDLGEFNLIELLRQTIDEEGAGISSNPELVIGIGDDAAVWQNNASTHLGTTDTLVQDVHFDLAITSWRDLGWKSLAVNVSDIAAMGGTPVCAMISLGLPPDTEVERIIELYKGAAQIAAKFEMSIAGGDISQSPSITITPTVIGSASKGKTLLRSGAATGDLIAVTGQLGASAAGLKVLQERRQLDAEIASVLREAHLRPMPRVAEGQILSQCGAKSAIDISDGLLADLTHICQASKAGAEIYLKDIPVHPATFAAFPEESTGFALTGGEDYELLFTATKDSIREIRKHTATIITIIGEIVNDRPGTVVLLGENGKEMDFNQGGWEHFRIHS